MPANQEIKFDPNAMQADESFMDDEDLGEFDSYVDKLEAEEAAVTDGCAVK